MDLRYRLLTLTLLAFDVGAAATARADAWPARDDLPAACAQAQAAYLAGDFAAFVGARAGATGLLGCMRVSDDSPTLAQNAAALAVAGYAANGGALQGDFHLPKEIKQLRIVQRRNEDRNGVRYVVEFDGKLATAAHIRALKLTRYPDDIVLDRQDGRFEFKEDADGFYLKRTLETPAPEGLYKVSVQAEGGDSVEAWVPLVDWASDRSPTVTAPQLDGGPLSANPVLSWQAFSTGDRGYAQRGFYAEIIRSEAPDYAWQQVWKIDGNDRSATTAVVGKEPRGHGVGALTPGRYLFSLTYFERRAFGDLEISKASNARVVFHVH